MLPRMGCCDPVCPDMLPNTIVAMYALYVLIASNTLNLIGHGFLPRPNRELAYNNIIRKQFWFSPPHSEENINFSTMAIMALPFKIETCNKKQAPLYLLLAILEGNLTLLGLNLTSCVLNLTSNGSNLTLQGVKSNFA